MKVILRALHRLISAVVLFVWGIPQQLAGFLGMVFIFLKDRKSAVYTFNNNWPQGRGITAIVIVTGSNWGAVTLGNFIFMDARAAGGIQADRNDYIIVGNKTIRHEYGHTLQGAILGPLYLLVIGVASILHAAFDLNGEKPYMELWTERWANKLAGVK